MKGVTVRVRHFRELAGLTQKELAAFLGVTKNTIVNYETGRSNPTMDIVVRMAHILNVTTDQLLSHLTI